MLHSASMIIHMSWAHIRLAAYSQGSRPTGMERRPRPRTNSQVNRPVDILRNLPALTPTPGCTEPLQQPSDPATNRVEPTTAVIKVLSESRRRSLACYGAQCTIYPLPPCTFLGYVRGLGAMFIFRIFRAIHRSLLHNSPFPPSTDT